MFVLAWFNTTIQGNRGRYPIYGESWFTVCKGTVVIPTDNNIIQTISVKIVSQKGCPIAYFSDGPSSV